MNLAISRQPESGESIYGYCLRLAEANYFNAVSWIAELDDVVEAVSAMIGKEIFGRMPSWMPKADDLQSRAWAGSRYFLLGEAARCCPECLKSKPYWRAIWEHSLYAVCHEHHRKLLDTCGNCGEKISWHRACLDRCICGQSYSNDASSMQPLASEEEVELADLLRLKLGLPSKPQPNATSKICSEAMGLDIDALSTAIQVCGTYASELGKRTTQLKLSDVNEVREVTRAAADLLSAWPTQFHNFLNRMSGFDENSDPSAMPNDGFLQITKAISKTFNTEDLSFVLEALREYMKKNWYRVLDSRNKWASTADLEDVIYMAAPNAARALGISWTQLRRLIAHGQVKAIAKRTDKNRKIWHVEKASLESVREMFGDRLSTAGVALFMGISDRRVEELTEAGLLLPAERVSKKSYREYSKKQVQSLLDQLRSRTRGVDEGKKS